MLLQLPHRIHIALGSILHVVGDDIEHSSCRVVAARDSFGALSCNADLATTRAVTSEKQAFGLYLQILRRHFAKVRVVHLWTKRFFISAIERNDDGRFWRRVVHAQDPDRHQPGFRFPCFVAPVRDSIVSFIANEPQFISQINAQQFGSTLLVDQTYRSLDADFETVAAMVNQFSVV